MTDLRSSEAEFRLPLNAVRQFIRKYVVISEEASDFLALWVAHTWCFEAALTTPYVRVVSAEPASGSHGCSKSWNCSCGVPGWRFGQAPQRYSETPRCSCLRPGERLADGRCGRCYGWPKEAA
jgi:hypothetical protein